MSDPTRPYGYRPPAPASADLSAAPRAEFRVSFVRVGEEGAVAIVNGQTVTVGDVVEGAEISLIAPDHIVVVDRTGAPARVYLDER